LKAKLAEIEQLCVRRKAMERYQTDRVDSSSQASIDSSDDLSPNEFHSFVETATAKIARLRRERNEARAIIQDQSSIHADALVMIGDLEAALCSRQKTVSPHSEPIHHRWSARVPRKPSNHALLSELHSLSRGVKALEKRNEQLTSLVDSYHTPPKTFVVSESDATSDPWGQSDSF
jgi:hypothetical protein